MSNFSKHDEGKIELGNTPASFLPALSPDQLKELWPIALPLLHPLLHGDYDGVGLVIRAVLGTLLRRPCASKSPQRSVFMAPLREKKLPYKVSIFSSPLRTKHHPARFISSPSTK
jgi:hypothetical protein